MKFIALLLSSMLIFSVNSGGLAADEKGAQIVVIGEGRVSVAPDKAVISMGAQHSARSAAEAMEKTNRDVAAILARLKAMGLEERDLQTSSLSLNPMWSTPQRGGSQAATPVRFEASNRVRATVRDLTRFGEILDAVVQDGANAFSGFSFGLQDRGPHEDVARTRAVEDAMRKARNYALDAGLELGAVELITEDLSGGHDYGAPVMDMALTRSGSVPVAAGEIEVRASVRVIFSASPSR